MFNLDLLTQSHLSPSRVFDTHFECSAMSVREDRRCRSPPRLYLDPWRKKQKHDLSLARPPFMTSFALPRKRMGLTAKRLLPRQSFCLRSHCHIVLYDDHHIKQYDNESQPVKSTVPHTGGKSEMPLVFRDILKSSFVVFFPRSGICEAQCPR